MYCGQCGKKVMDNMLFCPFCGSPIVIPEQDEPASPAPADERTAEAEVRQSSLFDDSSDVQAGETVEEQEDFVPLSFSFDEPEAEEDFDAEFEDLPDGDFDEESEEEESEEEDFEEEDAEELPDLLIVEEEDIDSLDDDEEDEDDAAEDEAYYAQQPSKRRQPPKAPEMNRRRENKTYIPVKEVDVDNLFMDEESLEEEDEYDFPEDFDSGYENEFEFEEPEEGGFVQRHIRGIVGLILMLVLVLIVLIWALSGKGQVTLAKLNLAWNPEVYADLGYEAYHQDADLQAARYYEKALARDPENYDYAHSAMVAYYEADRIESAAAMLKKCVEMRPDSVQPYQEMLILYPDAASRPWEIRELIKMGYQRTGDASLKIE